MNCKRLLYFVLYLLVPVIAVQCSVQDDNHLTLTPQETQFIQTIKKPIIIAPCPDYPPIDFTDDKGNFAGLSQDYVQIISQKLGIPFTRVGIHTWAEVLEAAQERKVDVVISIQDVPERHSYLRFTKPYVRIPNVVVVQKSNTKVKSIYDLKGMKVAAVKGYAVVNYITKNFPSYTLELVKNESEGLMKLAFGEYDAMIISLSTVSYLIDTYSITNLRVAGTVGYDWNLCIGVRSDNPLLYSVISKALDSIPENKRTEIYRKWVSLAPRPVYYEKEFWYILTAFLVGGLLIIIGIIAWNASFRRQVKIKTEQLENELYWHKKTQEQLLVEKERLLITIQSIGDAFISTDTQGTIILCNKQADSLFGNTISLGQNIDTLISFTERTHNKNVNPVQECIESGTLAVYHHVQCTCRQKTLDVSVVSSPVKFENMLIGVVTIIRDITDMLAMQEELIKLQQFESLGILAAGIAHDFNNILMAIMGNAEILGLMLPGENKQKNILDIVEGIKKSVKSAQSLTSQLLTYAKGGKPVKKSGNIVQLIKDTVDFVTHGTSVKVEYEFDSAIENFNFDEHQLSHVFRNLALNAVQSIENSGKLTITVKSLPQKPRGLNLQDGHYVMITFADTGKGIAPENINRIFDPYFTTKEKGTGLGLTTSLSIVKQHGGTITVSSSGNGTMFAIYIPKEATPVEFVKQESTRPDLLNAFVLILDDRDDILEVTSGMLEILGCTYDTATNSNDAIEKVKHAKNNNKPFTCVLFDVTIPGSMSGVDAFAAIKQIQPDIKGIVMSGYADNSAIADFSKYGFSWYLIKPFTFEDLKQALVKALQ